MTDAAARDQDAIRRRLREVISDVDLSYEEFARPLGFSPNTVRAWVSGTRRIRPRHIAAIANVYNVSDEWLKTGAGRKAKNESAPEASSLPSDAGSLYRQLAEERLERIRLLEIRVAELEDEIRRLKGGDGG